MCRLGPRTKALCAIALLPALAPAAAFTTKLQGNTVRAWDRYIARFEQGDRARERPLAGGRQPALTDANPDGTGAGEEVPGGYIHHWIAVMRLDGVPVARVESAIEDYGRWAQIYAPDVKLASAKAVPAEGGRGYDLRMITEQTDGLLHFAFDAHFRVLFRRAGDFELVDSRSYQIRESDSGHAPYTDLRPEGNDHGILWRLNTYWRLRDLGGAAYAECQVISLSRKPLFGTRDHVKARARDSLESTMLRTRDWAMR